MEKLNIRIDHLGRKLIGTSPDRTCLNCYTGFSFDTIIDRMSPCCGTSHYAGVLWEDYQPETFMDEWEKELRERLDKELPDGMYEIGGGDLVAWTGKGGKINFEVAFIRAAKNYCTPGQKGLSEQLLESQKNPPVYGEFNLDNFREELYNFFKSKDENNKLK